ncbi:Major facilitator superfamily domain, general substrate transporter [Penicillium italicum]|uniref:Major facilitator superfamily domain, general substrate transporter n=1 Tax=Penicillium italicum TaxID=40296 RepID=A0A0A2L6U4_PENIT|nr:Major facilitator superfamily domain, general substrate transporter [Penicillium italicum]
MQKLPFGKFVAALVFMWGVILLLHCVATTYAALVVLRLALGAAESVVVPAITILPWKLFMIITGAVSGLLSILVWLQYPNNPAEATFLSLEEKIHTIMRVHESSQSSIEQKQFKKSQFIETLRDPNLITKALGVDSLGSTLVAAAGGGFGVLVCIIGAYALRWWPSNLALHGLFWCVPAIAGGIGMVAMDWDQKLGMLACLLLAGHTYGNTYIIALGWTTSSAAGYTKKLTRNVMFMVGYSIENICSPQIWVPRDAPRYYGAWISIIVVSWAGTPLILFIIRFLLKRRNDERKAWD